MFFQQDNDPKHTSRLCKHYLTKKASVGAASDDLASTITQPQPNWDGVGWVGLHCEGKAANKCSAYVGTPSRPLEKQSRWSLLRECQECPKLSKPKGGYFEECKMVSTRMLAVRLPVIVLTSSHCIYVRDLKRVSTSSSESGEVDKGLHCQHPEVSL